MNILSSARSSFCGKLASALRVSIKEYRAFSVNSTDPLVSVVENEKLRTATVYMQRLPVNSINLELAQQVTAAIKDLEQKDFKGFVLASKSPTVFSAGFDIMEMYKPKEDRFREYWKSLQEMWQTLYSTPLISMAAINGHCPAGGCMLALSCDYRIMVDSRATIGMNETLLGIVAPQWFMDILINNVGFRLAEKSLYLGTLHTPQAALSINIVDELVANAEELESKIQQQMGLWLKIPGLARRMTKMALRRPTLKKFEGYKVQELEQVVQIIQSDAVQKGLQMYIDSLRAKKA